MGAMSALEESGVRVPDDVSVIGIDDISLLSWRGLPLQRSAFLANNSG